jgi:hypothetical protein
VRRKPVHSVLPLSSRKRRVHRCYSTRPELCSVKPQLDSVRNNISLFGFQGHRACVYKVLFIIVCNIGHSPVLGRDKLRTNSVPHGSSAIISSHNAPHLCSICRKPIDLTRDRYTDEDGQAVHESCYINRLSSIQNDAPDPHHTE